MATTKLALIFGGQSGEHEVSVVSARSIAAAVDRDRYEVVPMAIARDGRWADPNTARDVLARSGDRADRVVRFTGSCALDPRLLDGTVDLVFPVLHGPYGEDGTIQGLLEIVGLPYVGCGVTASAVCMDKIIAKRLLAHAGFQVARWVEVEAERWPSAADDLRAACAALGWPLFVKPACLGSSVGISKVTSLADLDHALAEAFTHDRRVVVEEAVDGREIEVAVLGDLDPQAAVPGEVIPGHEFYDYADKYLDDACQLLAPAPLEDHQRTAALDLAVRVFRHLQCEGLARVDLFLDRRDGRLWVNEVNTMPGFTSISMYPRLWSLSGVVYPALVDRLLDLAVARHRRRRR